MCIPILPHSCTCPTHLILLDITPCSPVKFKYRREVHTKFLVRNSEGKRPLES
jgi:hypothetical protein